MSHDTYDRLADWLEAREWTQTVMIWVGTQSLVFGLVFGVLVDLVWLLLLTVTLAAVLVFRIKWHGFMRHLDRKYPLVPELECSFDADAWNSALAKQERR